MDEKQSQEREHLILGRFRKQRLLSETPRVKKYLIRDAVGGERAEIKTMMVGEAKPTVLHEAGFLQQHQGYPGFPLMIWSGNYNNKQMGLITEPLGYSLQQLLEAHPNKRFSLSTVCLIGLEVLKILQILHEKSLVLECISPQVFRLYPSKVEQIMISDLLLCKRFRNVKTMQIFKLKKVETIDFFTHFMSFNKISGFNTSRRDDLESLFYMLVYLLKGELPWSTIPLRLDNRTIKDLQKTYNQLLSDQKSKIKSNLLQGLPQEFRAIFEYICKMGFQERPNYSFIRMKLKKVLFKEEQQLEPVFDWIRYLPQIHKQVLFPSQIKLTTLEDELFLQKCYYPWQDMIGLDHFSGVALSNGKDEKSSHLLKLKKVKNKNKCQLI